MILHGSNALWLISALPVWYFSAVAHPLQAGILSVVPFIGTLGLVAGAVVTIVQRRRTLLLFFLPFVASECYVAIAGSYRGQLHGHAPLLTFWIFIVVQIAFIGYAVYKAKGGRLAALAFAFFSASYTLFAALVGGMAFTDTWP